jgi:outer membrane receptor protein involved in Fe transport
VFSSVSAIAVENPAQATEPTETAGEAPAATQDVDTLESATTLDTELLLNAPVVTATGREQSRALAPANVVTWERDEIYRHGWRTLTQVLANTPGLYVIDDLVLPSVGVRGVGPGLRGGTRLIRIMINGVQVNFRPDLTAFLNEYIPIDVVERVEIAKGPLSALYGANAFLATVNIITRVPVTGLVGELSASANVVNGNGGYGFAGNAGYGDDHFSLMVGYDQQRINRSGLTLHKTFENQDPTSSVYAGFFDRQTKDDISRPKSLYALAEGRSDTLGILRLQGGRQMLDANASFQPNSLFTPSRAQVANNWGSANYILGYGKDVTFSATGGVSGGSPGGKDLFYTTNPDPAAPYALSYKRHNAYTAYDAGAALEAKLPAQLETKLGLDYTSSRNDDLFYTQTYLQPVGAQQPGTVVDRGAAGKHDITDFGLYGNLSGNPFSAAPDLYLSGNIRYDHPNLFSDQVSWRVGLAYQFSERVISKLFVGRAFQIPSATQLFAQPGFGASNNIIGNRFEIGAAKLEPQSVRSIELANTFALTNNLVVDVAVYYQDVRQKIEITQVSNNYTARNLQSQYIAGGEAGLRANTSRLVAYFYASTQAQTNREQGHATIGFYPPSELPVFSLQGGLTFRIPEVYAAIDATTRVIGARGGSDTNYYVNNRSRYDLNPYATVDVTLTSLGIEIFGPGYETRLMVSAHNITNARYSDPYHGGFDVPSIGRTWFFRVGQMF